MSTCVNLLIIDDEPADFQRIVRHLEQQGFTARCHGVATPKELDAAMAQGGWDAVLLDSSPMKLEFQTTLDFFQTEHPDLPVILLSDSIGEERAVELLTQQGVWDLVFTHNLSRLVPAIERSVRDAAARRAPKRAGGVLHEGAGQIRVLMEHATEGLILGDDQGQLLYWNPAAVSMFGYTSMDECRRHLTAFADTFEVRPLHEDRVLSVEERPMSRALRGEIVRDCQRRVRRIDQGWEKVFAYSGGRFSSDTGEGLTFVSITDITEHQLAVDTIGARDIFIGGILGSISDALFTLDKDWRYTFVNDAFVHRTGKRRKDLLGQCLWDLFPDATDMDVHRLYQKAMAEHIPVDFEVYYPPFQRWFATRVYPTPDGGLVVYSKDVTERKDAEELVRVERSILTSVMEHLHSGVVYFDKNGENCWMNPEALRIHGYSDHSEMLARFSQYAQEWELTDPDGRVLPLEEWPGSRAFRGERYRNYEVRLRHLKSGRTTDVLYSCSELRDANGSLERFVFTLMDITERKRTVAALRESEERLRLSTELAHVAVWEFNFVSGTMSRSANHDGLYGLPQQSRWEMETFVLATHPDDRALSLAAIQQSVAPGGPDNYSFDFRVVHPDQSVHWLQVVGQVVERSDTGQGLLVRGCLRDSTEHNLATEERTRLAMAVEQSAETILITSPDGTILYANPAFEKASGYTRAEALGQNPRVFKSDTHDAAFYREMWDTLGRGETWVGHLTNRRKDGTLYEEDASISPVHDAAGRVVNYVAVKRDVTEQRKVELQMLRSQRLESIGTLAGGIAHDLNNVLAPIMMSTELLRADYPAESETLDLIAASSKRAADMVRQLLVFAKGAKGERVSIQPGRVLKEIHQLLRNSFPKNIAVTVTTGAEMATVLGDATQLHQVLLNLCVNARDAMPSGGTLTIEAENRDVDALFASAIPGATPGPYVALRVRDTGTGMSPDLLNRVFDPFFTTKDPDKGTGLGLSTTMGIVKGHGGFLQVDSQLGQGSAFTVYLPAEETSRDASRRSTAATGFRGQGEIILFVDDDRAVREAARAVLRRLNFTPVTATDGADGLVQAGQHRTQLSAVITDLQMPNMDGLSLVRALRQMLPDLPIAVVSGSMDDALATEFKALGVTGRLDKPFTESQLATLLQSLLAPM